MYGRSRAKYLVVRVCYYDQIIHFVLHIARIQLLTGWLRPPILAIGFRVLCVAPFIAAGGQHPIPSEHFLLEKHIVSCRSISESVVTSFRFGVILRSVFFQSLANTTG